MSYEEYIEKLAELRSAGNWREALALSSQRFERVGKSGALVQVGEALLHLRELEAFDGALDRLINLEPKSAEIDRLRALRAEAEGDLDTALDCWTAYVAKEPNKPAPAFRIAQIHLEKRRYLPFQACLADLATRFPDHSKLRNLESQWKTIREEQFLDEIRTRALASTRSRQWAEALADWEMLGALAPDDVNSHIRVCDCLLELRRPREAWEILRSRLHDLLGAKRFADVFKRTIGLLAALAEPLHSVVDEAVLTDLAPSEVLTYARLATGRRDADEDIEHLCNHLERRGDALLTGQVALRLAEVNRLEMAWRLVLVARAQEMPADLDDAHHAQARIDLDFTALMIASKTGRAPESKELALRLRNQPDAIIADPDRFTIFAVVHYRLVGRDAFLLDLMARALGTSLASPGALFDAVDHFLRQSGVDMAPIILEVAASIPSESRADLAFFTQALLSSGESGLEAGGPPTPEFLEHCVRFHSDDPARFERMADTLLTRGRTLLLDHIFTAIAFSESEGAKLTRLRAQLASQLLRWDAAADLWATIVHQNRHDIWSSINMTTALINSGRIEEARREFARLALSPDMAMGAMRAELATCAARLDDLESATKISLELIENGVPSELRPHQRIALARILSIAGRPEHAWPLYGTPRPIEIAGDQPLAIILDPGFSVSSGHHLNYNLFAWRMIENLRQDDLDLSPVILCREAGEEASELSALRVISALKFEPYAYDDMPMLHRSLQGLNDTFYYDLSSLRFASDIAAVFVHSMRAGMIEGFSRWIGDVFSRSAGFVIVGLIEVDHLIQADHVLDSFVDIYRRGLERLAANPNVGLLVYVETDAGKNFLDGLHIPGLQVRVFPYLAASLCLDHRSAAPRDPADPICLGIVGGTRTTRGSHLIPPLIDRTSDLETKCRWKLQLNTRLLTSISSDDDRIHIENLALHKNVTIIDAVLSAEEYFSVLDDLDVVLLPYQDRYAVSGSGVLYESIYMGKFLVVPRNTFMPAALADLGHPHLVIEEGTGPFLEAAVRDVVERQSEILQQLQELRDHRQKRLPADEFQDLILDGIRRRLRLDRSA